MSGCNPNIQRCSHCGYEEVISPVGLEIPLYRAWHIRNRHAVREYVASLGGEAVEWVLALFVDDQLNLLSVQTIAVGDKTGVDLDIPSIVCRGVAAKASSFILVHNHPSGEAKPSAADMAATRRLANSAQGMGLQLLDHLIVAGDQIVRVGDDGSWSAPPPSTR